MLYIICDTLKLPFGLWALLRPLGAELGAAGADLGDADAGRGVLRGRCEQLRGCRTVV